MKQQGSVFIYSYENGQVSVDVQLKDDTLWLSLNQISELFGRDKSVISRHLKNVFKDGELERNSTVAFFATVQNEGDKIVERRIEYFNLDAILSVGYRVNSKQGTSFRKWASGILSNYLRQGYVLDTQKVTAQRMKDIQNVIDAMSRVLINKELVNDVGRDVVELISKYAKTWSVLVEYDENRLNVSKAKDDSDLQDWEDEEALDIIASFKKELIAKGEASDLFGRDRDGSVQSILANISQTFDSLALYDSNVSRAAHTLYYIIKDHPFVDGNKRIACLLFIYFLRKANIKAEAIEPNTLLTIALLIAESAPSAKDTMVSLVMRLLSDH